MFRYLFRVQYLFPDDTSTYEPVCVRAETEVAARAEVDAATDRYPSLVGATKAITLILTEEEL